MDIYEAINTRRTVRDFEDRQIDMAIIEKIIAAGLKAPTNDHMRDWEFVVIGDKSKRAEILKLIPETFTKTEVSEWLDSWDSVDNDQRNMYLDAVPKQHAMLYNAGCLILPFFKQEGSLLQPKSLSSLNSFASIWLCIENILLATVAEGIFGVTRIPMENESRHIKRVIDHPSDYIMPCYIALGYPAKGAAMPKQKGVSAKEKIRMNAW
ncbi:MAG: nitroreductase family protein [Defluviitaleaceae bacterium]|nr:nitroreductase family protein [Defluviitaleaceae bacterium]